MSYDLRSILDGWEYEPGKISVRKIIGSDGREKIQTRVDLGVLQFEPEGRPDGTRPFGAESLLDYYERRRREFLRRNGDDEGFSLSAEACRELRHEAHLYYQRYLSFFVLEEFDAVERDTERNLRLIDFCNSFADNDYDRDALESQRAYVMMMNTRARVYGAMAREEFDAALEEIEEGIEELRDLFSDMEEDLFAPPEEQDCELRVLESLRKEVFDKMPANSIPRLQRELEEAVEREDYELAAKLRDQLQTVSNTAQRV